MMKRPDKFGTNAFVHIRELKPGYGINHPKHGYLQYRGLVTKNPWTKKPKEPKEYLFWRPPGPNGESLPDWKTSDGSEVVEIIDYIESEI